MHALKAQVKDGRLRLDEPTDLPEGQIIELIPLDEVISTEGDDLDDQERAALHAAIEEGLDDADAGRVISMEESLAEIRALRCASK